VLHLSSYTGRFRVAAQQIRPWVTAVEGAHLAVGTDLQEQHGDELLGDRVSGSSPDEGCSAFARSRRWRAMARSSLRSTPGEFGLVVDGLAEAAEHGGDGTEGGEPVPADVAHHDPHTVLGADHLVQVSPDGGPAVGGELGRGDVQPVDARRQRAKEGALGGPRDLADLPELAQQPASDVQHQARADGEEDGAADDPGAEPVLLGERTGQFVRDRRRAPHGGQPHLQHPPQSLLVPAGPTGLAAARPAGPGPGPAQSVGRRDRASGIRSSAIVSGGSPRDRPDGAPQPWYGSCRWPP
jgi:hypothetical protein